MKKVTLVFPRFKYPTGDFSLGIAYVAGYLREQRKDIDISVLDTTFNSSIEYVNEYFKENKPDIVGIYSDTIMFNDAIQVAKSAKNFGAEVIFGGPHPTILPREVIKSEYVNAVCIGEGEEIFKEFVDAFYNGKNYSGIKGICFKKDNEVIKNNPKERFNNLDYLPFPAVDLFDIETYINKFIQLDSYSTNLRGMSLIVSRGCPFKCTYCQPTLNSMFGEKIRIMSPQKVVALLKYFHGKYGIEGFYFQDDTLTVFKKWMIEFCELLKKERLSIIWACNTRADTIDFEVLKIMRSAGCVKIKVGIESINNRIRNEIYKKKISVEQIKALLKYAKELNIQVAGFFMLGAPTETTREVLKTIFFAANSSLSEANFSITTPLPQTGLYNFVKDKGWILPGDFSLFDYYKVKRPKMFKDEINITILKLFKKFAYLFFYLHPKRIISTFKITFSIKGAKKTILKLKRF